MLPALLGALVSAGGIAAQMGAQKDANNINWRNLFLQERTARDNSKLAKATRSDAYGNKVEYQDGVGFITKLTPLQQAIVGAQQTEQLAQFRDDAPRARQASLRMDNRSKKADEMWNKRFDEYRFTEPETEKSYEAEAIRDAMAIRNEDDGGAGNAATIALRMGNTADLPNVLAAARGSKRGLAEVLAEAKRTGRQQFFAEQGARDATRFGELNQLRGTADATSQGAMNWENENAALSGRADSALSGLIATNQQGAASQGDAMAQLAASLGKSPDFGGLAASLGNIKMPEKGRTELEEAAYNQQLIAQLTGNLITSRKNKSLLNPYRGDMGEW